MSNAKAKRSRALLKRRQRGQLLDTARKAQPNFLPSTFVRDAFGYYDGKLIHTVFHGKRTLPAALTFKWPEHVVWATGCNRVIAVEKPRFAQTKQPPTCLTCSVDYYGR